MPKEAALPKQPKKSSASPPKRREILQRKAKDKGPTTTAPSSVPHVLRTSGESLEPAVRSEMESRFGHDFSQVRVHTDAKATESARDVNALAYTVGRNIVFAPGQYAPQTNAGRQLLAHELTHTVQQQFSPSAGEGHLPLGDPDDVSEQSAERMAKAVSSEGSLSLAGQLSTPQTTGPVIQRQPATDSPTAAEPSLVNEEPRLLAKFDMDNRRKRAWNLNQLTKEIGKAFLASERAYVRILGVYPPNAKNPEAQEDARADALHRADIVQQALHQWINPKKFPISRYSTSATEGQEGDPDIELWLEHGPIVVAPQLGREKSSAAPQAAPQKGGPPASQKYARPYPGTGMDALKAFMSTPLGEKFKEMGKKELKRVWDKTSVAEKIVILVSQLVTLGVGTYGLSQMSETQQKTIIDLITKDDDSSLLRPLPEKATNLLELEFDPDFRPKKIRPPLGEFDLP